MIPKGTDYYVVKKSLIDVESPSKRHIGRSASGWCFFLHIYPRDGIFNWEDMKNYLHKSHDNGFVIINNHKMIINIDNFVNIVVNRQRTYRPKRDKEWFSENFAKTGPNGLARRKVDGYLCVGNGKGTYDYVIGDFFYDPFPQNPTNCNLSLGC
jgi:hypothetical protein